MPASAPNDAYAAPSVASIALETPRIAVYRGLPYLTFGLIVLLALIFWAEVRLEIDPDAGYDPSVRSLAALGGLNATLVFENWQVWRLFTAPLLHGSLSHLVGNCVALLLAGWILERVIGARWFAALFVVSALGGAVGSLALNDPRIVSVGASGAITGLLAAAFVCSFIFASVQLRTRMQKISLRLLAPALLPAVMPLTQSGGVQVDYAAHIGGAIAGVLMGFVLYRIWPEDSERPQGGRLAYGIAIAGILLSAVSFGVTALIYPSFAKTPIKHVLIPEKELPPLTPEAFARSGELVEKYPQDPRAHLLRGIYFLKRKDLSDAERELRTALGQHETLANELPPDVERSVRTMLAVVLVIQGRKPEAKLMAETVCGRPAGRNLSEMWDYLKESGVCA